MVDDLVTTKKSGGLTIIDKINAHNANVFVGKLGDILYKMVDSAIGNGHQLGTFMVVVACSH